MSDTRTKIEEMIQSGEIDGPLRDYKQDRKPVEPTRPIIKKGGSR